MTMDTSDTNKDDGSANLDSYANNDVVSSSEAHDIGGGSNKMDDNSDGDRYNGEEVGGGDDDGIDSNYESNSDSGYAGNDRNGNREGENGVNISSNVDNQNTVQSVGVIGGLAPIQIPGDQNELSVQEASPTAPAAFTPTNVYIPSLRGTLSKDQFTGKISCKGLWALSDELHDVPGETGVFEFYLLQALEEGAFPPSGRHAGWFSMKQHGSKNTVKVDDKDLNILYTKIEGEPNCYLIKGEGYNKFGNYTLNGKLTSDMKMQMYREYAAKPIPVPVGKKKVDGTADQVATSPRYSHSDVISPRESSNRIRKVSSYIKEYIDAAADSLSSKTSPPKGAASTKPKTPRQSLSPQLSKCLDLLKDISKYGTAVYFLKPVDHVAYGIPDYPLIITNPMDLQTIRQNLESGKYSNPDEFADHMRLIFKNAITYNKRPDNAINIAARELNKTFDQKFRTLLSQINSQSAVESATSEKSAYSTRPNKEANYSHISGKSKPQSASESKPVGASKANSPRASVKQSVVNSAKNFQAQNVDELNRKLEEMKSEMDKLKSQLEQKNAPQGQTLVLSEPKQQQQRLLSEQEKYKLIQKIQNLPPDKMPYIIELIRSSVSKDQVQGNDDEIQIPIGSLDTATLWKLETYVNSANSEGGSLKRSISADSNIAKKPRAKRNPDDKPAKERKPRAKKAPGLPPSNEYQLPHDPDGLSLFEFDESEDF